MLVGTHADLSPARKNSSGEYTSPTQGVLKEKVGTAYYYFLLNGDITLKVFKA
jgi:hypothetical protein